MSSAFCMFPRSDGYLISAEDIRGATLTSGFVKFSMFHQITGNVYHYEIPFLELDGHFRFNVELMNPMKRKERYAWIAERISVVPTSEGLCQVELKSVKVSDLEDFVLCTNRTLPSGRFTEDDYRQVRDRIVARQNKREACIAARSSARVKLFLRHLSEVRQNKFAADEAKSEQEKNKISEAESLSALQRIASENERIRLSQLSDMREANIQKKLQARSERIFLQPARVCHPEKKNDAKQYEQEKKDYKANLAALEAKREVHFVFRAKKLKLKSLEYLKNLREEISIQKRLEKIKHEKRQQAAHALFKAY